MKTPRARVLKDTVEIPLVKGGFTIIDREDYEKVKGYVYYLYGVYAVRSEGKGISLHYDILGRPPKGLVVDHINWNPLDNRKSNLRFCTRIENQWNRGKQSNNTTGYKGVTYNKRANRYHAQCKCHVKKINGKKVAYIGTFKTAEEAALAYNKKAKELHGEYAYQNVIKEGNIKK